MLHISLTFHLSRTFATEDLATPAAKKETTDASASENTQKKSNISYKDSEKRRDVSGCLSSGAFVRRNEQ